MPRVCTLFYRPTDNYSVRCKSVLKTLQRWINIIGAVNCTTWFEKYIMWNKSCLHGRRLWRCSCRHVIYTYTSQFVFTVTRHLRCDVERLPATWRSGVDVRPSHESFVPRVKTPVQRQAKPNFKQQLTGKPTDAVERLTYIAGRNKSNQLPARRGLVLRPPFCNWCHEHSIITTLMWQCAQTPRSRVQDHNICHWHIRHAAKIEHL